MNYLKTFVLGMTAGLAISIGGIVFLASDSKYVGALFFTVGLFTICTFGLSLFTGKVCYALEQKPSYLLELLLIWLGNFCGCILTGLLMQCTRMAPALMEKAQIVCDTKMAGSYLSTFILGIFCNICIYIAVDGYQRCPHELGKYLALLFGVVAFILAGFEHCVANMFYFSMAGIFSGRMLLFLIINTLGNTLGGILLPGLQKLVKA